MARIGPSHHLEKKRLCYLSTDHILQRLNTPLKPEVLFFFETSCATAKASCESPDQIDICDTGSIQVTKEGNHSNINKIQFLVLYL